MTHRLIETMDDVAEGVTWLIGAEPRFAAATSAVETVPLRRRPGGFGGLLRIITGQQVSVAAAEGIWTRLAAAGATTPAGAQALDEAGLRACGLSAAKTRAALALAASSLDYDSLATLCEREAHALLCAQRGIGPWSADIYLMFCVGRADVFASGDLALQEAARQLFDLEVRPGTGVLAEMAAAWSPWRAVAARVLWAYYAALKKREGISL